MPTTTPAAAHAAISRVQVAVHLVLAASAALFWGLAASAGVIAPPVSDRLAVAWTGPGVGEGSVAALRAAPPFDLVGGALPVGPAARLRFARGVLYAVSRDAGTITVIDARRWEIVDVFDLGSASQPIDIAPIDALHAYVARAGATRLLRLDLQTGSTEESIDFEELADSDGVPDFGTMLRVGRRLFVQLRRWNDEAPQSFEAPAAIGVADVRTEKLIDADPDTPGVQGIALDGTPPKFDMQLIRETRTLVVNASGGFFDQGGIELVDLETLRSLGLAVREADEQVGADLGGLLLTCPEAGFLTYSTDLLLSSHLHRFDVEGNVDPEELSVALNYEAPRLEHALFRRLLFLPKTDGIAVFDSRTGASVMPLIETPAPPADLLLLHVGPRNRHRCPAPPSILAPR